MISKTFWPTCGPRSLPGGPAARAFKAECEKLVVNEPCGAVGALFGDGVDDDRSPLLRRGTGFATASGRRRDLVIVDRGTEYYTMVTVAGRAIPSVQKRQE